MNREPILRIRDVSVRFGGIVALDRVSFDVGAGEICGLIGPNGAGKTTLFNCLSRLYAPTEGEISFCGVPLLRARPSDIAALGIARTFQNLALFHSLSVRQNVLAGAHAQRRSGFISDALRLPFVRNDEHSLEREIDGLLELLDLQEVANKPVGALPFGTKKRVELARALASRPKLLLLDEPAGGLNHHEVDRLRGIDRDDTRRTRSRRAAGRTSHESRHARVRPSCGARFRSQDCGRNASRNSAVIRPSFAPILERRHDGVCSN